MLIKKTAPFNVAHKSRTMRKEDVENRNFLYCQKRAHIVTHTQQTACVPQLTDQSGIFFLVALRLTHPSRCFTLSLFVINLQNFYL